MNYNLFAVWILSFLVNGIASFSFPGLKTGLQSFSDGKIVSCSSRSHSPKDFFWEAPDGKRIETAPSHNVFAIQSTNELKLIVQNPDKTPKGIYICHEIDNWGKHYQTYYNLEIKGPPVFRENFKVLTEEVGSEVEIYCTAEGDPEPSYVWYNKLEVEVTETEGRIYIKRTENDNGLTLVIRNIGPEHQGLYACSAKNEGGLVTKIYQLIVVESKGDKTDIVGSINVLEVTESSLLFHIGVANPTSQKQDILVRYQERLDRIATAIIWKFGDRKEIKNLNGSGLYTFQFKVYPQGNWSENFKVVLLPNVPEILVSSMSGGNIGLNFFQSTNDIIRGTIDKYLLSYFAVKEVEFKGWVSSECEISVEVPKCRFPRYEIAGLTMNTYYELRIKAHTISGYGKPYIQRLQIT